jgi:hypothetical protein
MPLIPELFDLDAFERLTTPEPPALNTPLGSFRLRADLTPQARATDAARLRAGDVDLFIWDDPLARVELRVFTPAIELPDGLTVSGVRAAVWRVRARQPLDAIHLSCELDGDIPPDPAPESGQGLESVAWDVDTVHLSLGTPDAEALKYYADDGFPFPESWRATWGAAGSVVEYRRRGLCVKLPSLRPDELAQTHFVVAWAPAKPPSDATWFAVDQSPRTLLRHREPAV